MERKLALHGKKKLTDTVRVNEIGNKREGKIKILKIVFFCSHNLRINNLAKIDDIKKKNKRLI